MKVKRLNEIAIVKNFKVDNLITTVSFADDWEGIFLGDKKVIDGHSIRYDIFIEYLIKNNAQMGDYKYVHLELYRNGKYVDWVEDEDGAIFGWELPESLSEYIDKCIENRYEIKLNTP